MSNIMSDNMAAAENDNQLYTDAIFSKIHRDIIAVFMESGEVVDYIRVSPALERFMMDMATPLRGFLEFCEDTRCFEMDGFRIVAATDVPDDLGYRIVVKV